MRDKKGRYPVRVKERETVFIKTANGKPLAEIFWGIDNYGDVVISVLSNTQVQHIGKLPS